MRGRAPVLGTLLASTMLVPAGATIAFAQDTAGHIYLDVITVVPSRYEERAIDVPAGVSIVSAPDMEILQPVDAADLFFGMPGVVVSQGGPRTDGVANIRGLQDFGRVVVVVDGARNNFYQNNHGNKTTFWVDPEFMRQATVVRGPVSNTYGSGAIGGVIAFETLNPDDILLPDEKYATELRSTFQSNGTGVKGTGIFAARFNSAFDAIGAISGQTFNDYKDGNHDTVVNSANDGIAGFLKGRFRPGEFSELTLSWIGSDKEWRDGGATPSATGYDTDLRQDTFTGKFTYADPSNPLIDFRGSAYATSVDKQQYKYQGSSGVGTTRNFDLLTTGFDVVNTSRFETGALLHTLTYGGDWFHDDFYSSEGLFTPSGDRWAYGAYVQDRIVFNDWLRVTGAVRYDAYELDGDGINVTDDRISPRVTAEISPFANRDLTFFATYAHGYRAPSVGETLMNGDHPAGPMTFPLLPNPGLGPETSKGFEVGVNHASDGIFRPGDALRSKAVYFDNRVANYIGIQEASFGEPIPTGTCTSFIACYYYDNYDQVDLRGFELETEYDAGTWFGGLSASIVDASFSSSDVALSNSPRDRYTVRLGRRFSEQRLTIGGEVQYVASPRQTGFSSSLDPAHYEGYTLVNLFASWEPTPDHRFDLRIENLFNEAYGSVINAADGAPLLEPGLTVKVSAAVRFGAKDKSAALEEGL